MASQLYTVPSLHVPLCCSSCHISSLDTYFVLSSSTGSVLSYPRTLCHSHCRGQRQHAPSFNSAGLELFVFISLSLRVCPDLKTVLTPSFGGGGASQCLIRHTYNIPQKAEPLRCLALRTRTVQNWTVPPNGGVWSVVHVLYKPHTVRQPPHMI